MRSIIPRILVPALLLGALPAAAQQRDLWIEYDGPRRLEIAVGGGMYLSTDWSDLVFLESVSREGGVQRQVLLRELAMAPEFGANAAVTYWRGRYGFRVHAGFARSCLTNASRCDERAATGPNGLGPVDIDMDAWSYGVQGVVGLIEHTQAQWFRPYLVVGAGGVTYDLERPLSTLLPTPITSTGPAQIGSGSTRLHVPDDPLTFLIASDEVGLETKFALNLGVGTDFRIPVGPGGVSLRLELADMISQSPVALRVVHVDGTPFRARSLDEVEFNGRTVHNWRLSAGIAFEFGLRGYSPPPTQY